MPLYSDIRIHFNQSGNAMLIGVGGSGKQSLTRMAAYVCHMSCLMIEINRGSFHLLQCYPLHASTDCHCLRLWY
jgi:ABC-type transport system involved in cytochrome c biogenesis ATPase subunit